MVLPTSHKFLICEFQKYLAFSTPIGTILRSGYNYNKKVVSLKKNRFFTPLHRMGKWFLRAFKNVILYFNCPHLKGTNEIEWKIYITFSLGRYKNFIGYSINEISEMPLIRFKSSYVYECSILIEMKFLVYLKICYFQRSTMLVSIFKN